MVRISLGSLRRYGAVMFVGMLLGGYLVQPHPEYVPAPSQAQATARASGLQLLEQATRAHAWTEDDARQLRQLIPQMSPSGRDEALLGLAKRINAGELNVAVAGPPSGR